MMRLWTINDTETFIKIFYWFASHARSNFRTIACLTIQVTRETLLSDLIGIGPQGTIIDAIRSIPLLLLENNHIGHIVWCIRRAIGIAFTISKER
jgi:hypothetical protein